MVSKSCWNCDCNYRFGAVSITEKQSCKFASRPSRSAGCRSTLRDECAPPQVSGQIAREFGPVVFFRVGVQKLAVVSSAEAAEELLRQRDTEFCDRATQMSKCAAKYLGMDWNFLPFHKYDADYSLKKKFVRAEMMSTGKLNSAEKIRTREVAVMVEKVFSVIQSDLSPVLIRELAQEVVQNIIFELVIGKRFDSLPSTDELRGFRHMLDTLVETFMTFNPVDYYPSLAWFLPQGLLERMTDVDKAQRKFYGGIVQRSRRELRLKAESKNTDYDKEGRPTPLVDVFLQAQDNGAGITDIGVMATVASILNGAIDPTRSEITWVLLEVVRHPEILRRLQQELDEVIGKDRPLKEDDIQAMPLLNAIVMETLRLHASPTSFPHVNMRSSILGSYNIPAMTAVLVNIYSINRDPKRWEDPTQFNPDRFLEGGSSHSESNKAIGSCYHFLPFGSGRRMCPGHNLAILLLRRVVGTLLHAFDWSPPPGCSVESLSTEAAVGFNAIPTPGIRLVPTPRLSSHVYNSGLT